MRQRGDDKDLASSTRVRDQPSLTTSSGRSWIVLGGLLSFIAVGVMIPMLPLQPAGVALIGICLIVACYAGMLVARINAPAGRPMLAILAALMISIAVIALVCVGVVAAHQGRVVF